MRVGADLETLRAVNALAAAINRQAEAAEAARISTDRLAAAIEKHTALLNGAHQ